MSNKQIWTIVVVVGIALSSVAYFTIAKGELVWGSVHQEQHESDRKVAQEQRAAKAVDAVPTKAPVKISLENGHSKCSHIDSAEVDGEYLVAYVKNRCSVAIDFVQLTWKLVAPDGTVIGHDYVWVTSKDFLDAGERIEHKTKISDDWRGNALKLRSNSFYDR